MKVAYARCETLAGTYTIYPCQPPRHLAPMITPVDFTPADPKIYSSPANFPQSIVELKTEGSLAGYRLAGFIIYPVQYAPATKKLFFYPELRLAVSYAPGAEPQPRNLSLVGQRILTTVAKSVVINQPEVDRNGPPIIGATTNTIEYVVITSDDLASAFTPLIDWQNKKGVRAKVVTVNWIYARYPGRDNAEKIRNCIVDAYKNWGTVWVLLGGGVDVVPARLVHLAAWGEVDNSPSDLYFSDLDGTWDANHNGIFGELEDSLDLFPDVFVGRLPAESEGAVTGFINKLLTYEKTPKPDHGRRMLFMAFDADDITPSEECKEMIQDESVPLRFYPEKKIYDTDPGPHKQNCLAALASGYNIINHIDHGDYEKIGAGWINHGDVITIADIQNLHNLDRPSILYSVSCMAGGFHKDCIGSHLVTNPQGGMIGFIGNASLGWYLPSSPGLGPSEHYDRQFFSSLLTQNLSSLGSIFAASRLSYIAGCQTYGPTRWLALDLNLLGDPEVMVLTDNARPLEVLHPGYVTIGPSTVTVTVSADDRPVAGALVCVMKDTEVYGRGFTDAAGHVPVAINPATTGSLSITATAQNFIPAEATVTVAEAEGPYLVVLDQTTDDRTGGNGDGLINAGEKILYRIQLKNVGSEAARFVKAQLTTTDPYVFVSDREADYGDIPPGSIGFCTPPFQFSVLPGCPGNHTITFDLTTFDRQTHTWTSHSAVRITGPALSYESYAIDDRTGGNGNSQPDAGEVDEMAITMRNLGSLAATGVTATLATADPFIKLLDEDADFGTIKVAGAATDTTEPYRFYVYPECPHSHPVLFHLNIRTAGVYAPTDSFTVTVSPYPLHFTNVTDSAAVTGGGGESRGCAFGDFNQDQYLDLVVGSRDRANILYQNLHHDQFSNVAEPAGVAHSGSTNGVCFGDVNNDGFPDLFVANDSEPGRLFQNNGNGTFTDITDSARITNGGCLAGTFADVNRDGYLDLFLTGKDGDNTLFLSNGNGTFTNCSQKANLTGLAGSSMGIFADVNNDGAQDLLVVNRVTASVLYLNDGTGKFSTATDGSGLEQFDGANAAVFGDYNNDGNLDLFLIRPAANLLLRNDGKGHFTDVTAQAGLSDSSHTRGAQFGDVNNDGDLDIYCANVGRNILYLNRGNGTFVDATDSACLSAAGNGTGCAFGDIDNDGDLDLYVATANDSNILYRNDKNTDDFLEVRVIGIESNRDGIGSRVKIYDAGHAGESDHFRQLREVSAGSNGYSTNSLICHFGVPPGQRYDVEAAFPGGAFTVVRAVRAGSIIDVTEPPTGVKETSGTGPPRSPVLYQNYPNPFARTTRIKFFIPEAGWASLRVYDAAGRIVRDLLDTWLNPGEVSVLWNGKDGNGQTRANGIYFYRIESGRFSAVKKMVILR